MPGRWVSLNLTEKYAPSFNEENNWPVAREVICNAIDADPDGHTVTQSGSLLEVVTKTVPTIDQILVIGEGTKTPGGETIGQFGEGLKVAANAVCRAGGRMTVELPGHRIRYAYRKPRGFTVDTLHAEITEAQNLPQCRIRIELAHVGTHADKILPKEVRRTWMLPRKAQEEEGRLYHKGVWVANLKGTSMFHWNMQHASINRDRGVVNMGDLQYYIGLRVLEALDLEMCERFLETPDAFDLEIKALSATGTWHVKEQHRKLFEEAFKSIHGDNVVVATDNARHNSDAAHMGFQVAKAPDALMGVMIGEGSSIKRSRDVLLNPEGFEFVAIDPAWEPQLEKMRALAEIWGLPSSFQLKVFKKTETSLGWYSRLGESCIVALSDHLFDEGQEVDLFGTFTHECAHHVSNAPDNSMSMELAMARLAGKMAVGLFNKTEI